jgi:uncharacterized protein YyaL (SSP411 family)
VALLREVKDQLGSPYLIDHADNPVDWWTWDAEALDEARRRDVPIFLSIGYAACHWCHVMAHESFEDRDVAMLLNDSFVAIKVDREERPDVDALYMAATQLISGHGGWPMSVFLLPDGQPFMAGTYYPPVDRHGQVGFTRLLRVMRDAWQNQRDAVMNQAAELRGALDREISFIDHLANIPESLDLVAVRQKLRDELVARVDADGGFGDAPKFPRPSYVEALLDFDDPISRAVVVRTLEAMSRRGLYDHFEGGFARYSVDAQWHVPHFEKMLSDQALLARAYLRASRAIETHPHWRDVALDALGFVLKDLRVQSGYGSSLDADAAGIEGSHVTWTPGEVADALGLRGLDNDTERVLARWSISSPGLFEGRSIPMLGDDEPFRTPDDLRAPLRALQSLRAQRPQPSRDGKVILEWNAMLASALVMTNEPSMTSEGFALLESLASTHFGEGTWWRTERHQAHATACDIAWFIDANIDAFESTGVDEWLDRAETLSEFLLEHYWDGEVPSAIYPDLGHGIFSQSDLVTDLISRPKDVFDGATPSSHAVACRAFARLALCTGNDRWHLVARRLVALASELLASHPGAVPDLVEAAGYVMEGIEVVVPGAANELSNHVRLSPMSSAVLITGEGKSALLQGRKEGWAYVCRSGACQLPVNNIADLDQQLRAATR